MPRTVQRISNRETKGFLERFVAPRIPVVVERAASWPALSTWTFALFRERYAQRTIDIGGRPMVFGKLLDLVEHSTDEHPAPYLHQLPIADYFPELLADVSPAPDILFPNWLQTPLFPAQWGMRHAYTELFVGGRGAGFPLLHYDLWYVNTFMTQVVGSKDVTLFAPEEGVRLYPRADLPHFSSIPRLEEVDLDEFPLFAEARPLTAHLEAGDTLFVPHGWWHAWQLCEPSIAVSMSTVNRYNFEPFVRDYTRGAGVTQLAKEAYLRMVGSVLAGTSRLASHKTG